MAKKKQPYIPLYTGDYIKDTRSLSLAAKGAWSDIILFMWAQETDGVMIGSLEDFARLIGGTLEETEKVLLELCLKKICDGGRDEKGIYKIVSRRLVKDAAISAIRSEVGSKGGSKTQAKVKAKTEQKSDNDIDIENDIEFKYHLKESEKKVEVLEVEMETHETDFSKPDIEGDELVFPIDTGPVKDLWCHWKKYRYEVHNARYGLMGEQADLKRLEQLTFDEIQKTILSAIANKWKNLYPEKNGNSKTTQRGEAINARREAFAKRHGAGTGN